MNCVTCGKRQGSRVVDGQRITFPCRDYVDHRNAEVSALLARAHTHAVVFRDGVRVPPERLDLRLGHYPMCYQIHGD